MKSRSQKPEARSQKGKAAARMNDALASFFRLLPASCFLLLASDF
jgi:hypothetical protein